MQANISPSVGPGIIVECKSGIVYTRQTGGININMPEIEGCYLPFDFDKDRVRVVKIEELRKALSSLFDFKSKYGGRSDAIDEETAAALDDVLDKLASIGPLTEVKFKRGGGLASRRSFVRVDRDMLQKSHEAWVFVVIKRDDDIDMKGVLTWENSD